MTYKHIFNKFLTRRFFYGVGLVVLIVAGIIFAVTFVERLPSNPTIFAALMDAWTRLLEYIPMFLPLTVFMGTLVAAYNLTKSSELIIISGAGLSPYQIARPFLIGAALIGVFATTVLNPYSVNLSSRNTTSDRLQLVSNSIWLRETSNTGYTTMVASGIHRNNDDLVFENITVYNQTPDFKLETRLYAQNATLSDDGLSATNGKIWNTNGRESIGNWSVQTNLTPQTILDRYLQPDQISFWHLPRFIQKMNTVGVPVRKHLVQLWTLTFLPLTMIAMAMLGVAFSQTKQRRNYTFGVKFALGILTCFAVYFLTNIFNALGATGTLPVLLAIIAPPLIIIAAAGMFIASYDTI